MHLDPAVDIDHTLDCVVGPGKDANMIFVSIHTCGVLSCSNRLFPTDY